MRGRIRHYGNEWMEIILGNLLRVAISWWIFWKFNGAEISFWEFLIGLEFLRCLECQVMSCRCCRRRFFSCIFFLFFYFFVFFFHYFSPLSSLMINFLLLLSFWENFKLLANFIRRLLKQQFLLPKWQS